MHLKKLGTQQYIKVSGLVEKKIGDELVIVPMSTTVAQMNKVFSLNELGSFIFENLTEAKNIEDIVNIVIDEFEVTEAVARPDIESFLSIAVEANVIEITN